jgi:hydroxymethylpyrimidine pyrophosphatase-like HAD family hydrolase
MPGIPIVRAYHLVPAGASKARAVARHMQARGYGPEDCIAAGDSREDMETAQVVGRFWLVANALDRDPELASRAGRLDRVQVASGAFGAGVYEAVVTTLAERS